MKNLFDFIFKKSKMKAIFSFIFCFQTIDASFRTSLDKHGFLALSDFGNQMVSINYSTDSILRKTEVQRLAL